MKSTAEKQTRQSALIVAVITSFLGPFMISSINIALPAIGEAFNIDAILISWIVNAFLLSTAIFLVPAGRLADIFGRKKIFRIGLIVFTISTFFCGFSPNVYILIILRVFQGLGASMTMTTGAAILISVFPKEKRGNVLGINVSAVYLGLATGPFAGGILTQQLGWESNFFVSVGIGIIGIYFALTKLKGEWADSKGEKFDFIGTTIYSIALIALIWGASSLPEILGSILLLAGFFAFIIFVLWENRQKYPVFEVKLFKGNRLFTFSNLAALINYSATFAVGFLLSLYLQYIKGYSPQEAGIILVSQPVLMALLSPYAGKLSDRIEPGIIASSGMLITALGLFIFVFLDFNTPLWLIVFNLSLMGVGFALFSSPNMNTIMSSVERKYYGIASGSASTMRLLGQMMSMSVATVIFAVIIGREEISPANYQEFIICLKRDFIIFSMLCLVGVYFSYSRGKLR